MSESTAFSADHRGFYRNEVPFYPLVQDAADPLLSWSNCVLIRLPALLSDDLDWTQEMQVAKRAVEAKKDILWEIDLGLGAFQFLPNDSASFYAFSLALEEFSKKVWPEFQSQTFGVALYRGKLSPQQSFPMAYWESAFAEGNATDYDLFCVQLLSEYLHRLVSFLPDSAVPFALIDISGFASPTKIAQFFSKERFEYLHLALKGADIPFSGICWEEGEAGQGWLGLEACASENLSEVSLGVYLPKDEYIHADLVEKMDGLIASLQQKAIPFRIVCEEKLTEQWDGLDRLIVPSSALSVQGKRKLLGFIAAGGSISTLGEPIGLPDEELIIF